MWNWPWRQRSRHRTPPVQFLAAPAPAHRDGAPAAVSPAIAPELDLVTWLLDAPPPCDDPLRPNERTALVSVDALIEGGRGVMDLLPRAPAVIPQLLSALRQRDPSLPALVARVSKDLVLAAEVMRMARSALYAGRGPDCDLAHAIAMLGEQGLRIAIARVVLRPLLQAGGGALSVRAAPRLWEHTEHSAHRCSMKAAAAGLDPFDGYMAGLLHSAGWTAALRQLDRCGAVVQPWTSVFARELAARRDPLFGKVVGAWQVSSAITALAEAACGPGLVAGHSTLARLLLESDREASIEVLHRSGSRASPVASLADAEPFH